MKAQFLIFALTAINVVILGTMSSSAQGSGAKAPSLSSDGKPTILLVHGAYADGSSWNKVIPKLLAAGYKVVAVQNPLTSLADDVANTRRVLEAQTGPVVLVGHSWGGLIITELGNDERVKSLVYVASFAPSEGQSITDMTKDFPTPSGVAHVTVDKGGFVSLTLEGMTKHFAQDLPLEETRVMAVTQGPIHAKGFEDKVTFAAWKNKPSWFIVSEQDRMIHPDLQRANAKKISARVVSLPTGHVPQGSKPTDVADAIIAAAAVPDKTKK